MLVSMTPQTHTILLVLQRSNALSSIKTTPICAATNKDFMLERTVDGRLLLKRMHVYYSQVQGQMGRKWCDFTVYTKKGINVECLQYDPQFWETEHLPKLYTYMYLGACTYTCTYACVHYN